MKRVIFLLIILFSLTGCSVEYNLTIDSQDIKEEMEVTAYATEEYPLEALYSQFSAEYPTFEDQEFPYYDPYTKLEGNNYYNRSYKAIDNGYIFNYQTNYTFNDYNRARSLSLGFINKSIGYVRSEDFYYISLAKPKIFNNYDLDLVQINVRLNGFEVIDHNADVVEGEVYTWNISKDDKDRTIDLKYRKIKEVVDPSKEDNPNIDNPDSSNEDNNEEVRKKNRVLSYILIGGIVSLFLIGILGFIKYQSTK